MEERDERTIHRLEAFSDIVMGFALAELTLNLGIPKDPQGLAHSWVSLNFFAFSFVLIAATWWNHHKLFVTYFVLNPASILMNFAMLGTLALGIYFQQVAAHFVTEGYPLATVVTPFRLWLVCWAIVYALLAAMLAIGLWYKRKELAAQDVRWGVNRVYRALIAGTLSLIWLAIVLPSLGHRPTLIWATAGAVVVTGILRRLAVPRITAYLLRSEPAA